MKKLESKEKIFLGVCNKLSEYINLEVLTIRLIIIGLTLIYPVFFIIYILLNILFQLEEY